MLARISTAILAALLSATTAAAAEHIELNYQYEGGRRADFSAMRGTLGVAEFSDNRGLTDGHLIVAGENGGAYRAEVEMAAAVRAALRQGLAHGGAVLVDDGADFSIDGGIDSITAETVDGEIRLTMRVELRLNRGERTIWQTSLFGRGAAEDIAAATRAALDRLIRELLNDDYFRMELQ